MKINWKFLILCLAIFFAIAYIGSTFVGNETNSDWYANSKSSLTPPNFVFPIVWNILFLLIGISLYLCWTSKNTKYKWKISLLFAVNLIYNALWSFLFFAMKRVDYAFYGLIIIWLTIVGMIFISYKMDKRAAYLLVPYFLWTSFAGILNYLYL